MESHHASRVLRVRAGDAVELFDGRGRSGAGTVEAAGSRKRNEPVLCRIDSLSEFRRGAVKLRLLISPPRTRLMGEIVRMATELGVGRITPVLCERSVARPDAGQVEGHWRREAIAAVKQSGNKFLPQLDAPVVFATAVEGAPPFGFVGAVPRSAPAVRLPGSSQGADEVALWIGPEGGFSEREEHCLLRMGMIPLTVGQWVLRVETAVGALLGQVIGIIGNDQLRCECG